MLALDGMVDSKIYKRICLCFQHMKLSCHLQPFLIVLESTFVILEFPVHPPNAVWHSWKPETITISSRDFYSLFERGNTSVSYTHLRAHETPEHLVCRLLLE